MSEGPGGPQGATAGGTLAMRMSVTAGDGRQPDETGSQRQSFHCTDAGSKEVRPTCRQAGR